jgi:colanic acid biosynthesis glycosyl transferase WcaI
MFYGAPPERRIRRVRPLQDDFVVGYVGNHGLAQGLETALDAARCLEREPVRFLLIGEGVEKRRLEQRARAARLKNVRFLRGVPRTRVPGLLKACDALLVILRDDPLFRITIPSKVYEYMAAGKPVLCSVEGECADLVAEARCGLAIPPGDGQALAAAIRQLTSDAAAARAMGESGANWVRAHCDRSSVMEAYHRVLREALHNPPRNVVGREGLKAEVSSL